MSEPAHIRLKTGRDKAVRQGHPWIFSGAVDREEGDARSPLARVASAGGEDLGLGFYSPRSQIRVRLLGRLETVGRDVFAARLKEAAALRRQVLPPETTGYRLLNAEGDGVPGWTLDRYGDVVVSQITSAGLELLRDEAYAALRELVGEEVAILQMNRVPARREEGLGREDEVVAGDPPKTVSFLESGLSFTADLEAGQKTGFYCDQRENRRLVERLAAGKTLLDLFAHGGAFSLYALRGGAASVVAVESSPRLQELGREHLRLNGFADDAVRYVRANVSEDLRERRERYGIVVCDPPPLVRRASHRDRGARAYKDLNRLALQRVEPGGFFLTFSCSAAVDSKLFRQILFSAAVEAGVRLSLLRPLAAAADHPVAVTHPQGEYLKGWLGVVTGEML